MSSVKPRDDDMIGFRPFLYMDITNIHYDVPILIDGDRFCDLSKDDALALVWAKWLKRGELSFSYVCKMRKRREPNDTIHVLQLEEVHFLRFINV